MVLSLLKTCYIFWSNYRTVIRLNKNLNIGMHYHLTLVSLQV